MGISKIINKWVIKVEVKEPLMTNTLARRKCSEKD